MSIEENNKQEEFLYFIYDCYEDGLWIDHDDELQKIVNELFNNLDENKTYKFEKQKFQGLGLNDDKIKIISNKYQELCIQFANQQLHKEQSLMNKMKEKYGNNLEQYFTICQLIEGMDDNIQLLGENPKKSFDQLVGLIEKKDMKKISFYLKQKKISENSRLTLENSINQEISKSEPRFLSISEIPLESNRILDTSSYDIFSKLQDTSEGSTQENPQYLEYKQKIKTLLNQKKILPTENQINNLINYQLQAKANEIDEIYDIWKLGLEESQFLDTLSIDLLIQNQSTLLTKEEQFFNIFKALIPNEKEIELNQLFPKLFQAFLNEDQPRINECMIILQITRKNIKDIQQQWKQLGSMQEFKLTSREQKYFEYLITQAKLEQNDIIFTTSYKDFLKLMNSNTLEEKEKVDRFFNKWKIYGIGKQRVIDQYKQNFIDCQSDQEQKETIELVSNKIKSQFDEAHKIIKDKNYTELLEQGTNNIQQLKQELNLIKDNEVLKNQEIQEKNYLISKLQQQLMQGEQQRFKSQEQEKLNLQSVQEDLQKIQYLKEEEERLNLEKQKEQLYSKEKEELNERKRFSQKHISNQLEIIYQQEDQCLEQVTKKVVVNSKNINKLIQSINSEKCRCIGFFGNYQMSYSLLSEIFPNIKKINLDSYRFPQNDKIIGYSDGENIFLIYQESQLSFEGDIYDNDDGILYIRYLLDTCHLVIMCLNDMHSIQWSDQNPFEDFISTEPPLIIKDRSCVVLKQIRTNLTDKNVSFTIKSSLDCYGIFYRWKEGESQLLDYQGRIEAEQKINQNYFHLREYSQKLFQHQKNDPYFKNIFINMKTILDIFAKNEQLKQQVQKLFDQLHKDFLLINNDNKIRQQKQNEKINIRKLIEMTEINIEKDKYSNQDNNNVQEKKENQMKMQDEGAKGEQTKEFRMDIDFVDKILIEIINNNCKCNECFNKIKNCQNCYSLQNIVQNIDNIFKQTYFVQKSPYCYQFENKKYNAMNKEQIVSEFYKDQKKFNEKSQDIINYNYIFQNFFEDSWKQFIRSVHLSDQINFKKDKDTFKKIINIVIKNTVTQAINNIKETISYQDKQINSLLQSVENFQGALFSNFKEYQLKKEQRIYLNPLIINYNQIKNENFISVVQNLKDVIIPSQAHTILDYISFDQIKDYIISCNTNDPFDKQKVTIWIVERKKKVEYSQIFKIAFEIPGNDVSIHINPKSNQWVIFENKRKKCAIGRINGDYSFEEGRLPINIYNAKINGCLRCIERVDQCFILNDIENYIYLYEKSQKMYYQVSLTGKVQVKDFKLQVEVDNKLQELEKQQIYKVFNNIENEIYAFETDDSIKITNPNYIVKNEIKINRDIYIDFKLVQTETDLLLIVMNENLNLQTYIIQDEDDDKGIHTMEITESSISDCKKGNVVVDKLIRAVQYYGQNFSDLGCPTQNNLLCYFSEEMMVSSSNSLSTKIKIYIENCFERLSLNYRIQNQVADNSSNRNDIILRILQLLKVCENISKKDIEFLLLTRIPIQLTTIQQANYIPLKDGFFSQEFMELRSTNEFQIDSVKNKITLGWYEELISRRKDPLFIISMCGRQSVGKSSQLNRMFGTRFGVSAARCTDGVWLGYTIIKGFQVLILDCEGLFSIRRTEEEELKLLQQITLISDVSIVLNDLEGVSQPLLDIFKKLQLCVGKKKGDGIYFQGALYFLTKNIQDNGDKMKIESELRNHLENNKQTKMTLQSIFRGKIGYGYLKPFLSKEYDLILKDIRNTGIFGHFIEKSTKTYTCEQTISYLKYSMVQIFLDDDTDIELVSKLNEIKKYTYQFKEGFLDLTKMEIPEEKFLVKFKYQPLSDKEDNMIVKDECFSLENSIEVETNCEKNENEIDYFLTNQVKQVLIFNQNKLQFSIGDYDDICLHQLLSQRRKQLQRIFEQNYFPLSKINHNNYYNQLQDFFNQVFQQRKEIISQYYENKLPKQFKFQELSNKYKIEFYNLIDQISEELQICKKQCKQCNRICNNQKGHISDCNCETSHICVDECSICSLQGEKQLLKDDKFHFNPLQCFLKSGHEGIHLCQRGQHLCEEKCQISSLCKETCKLDVNHDQSQKHNCQEKHQCIHKCCFYEKCKKSCKFLSGHEEDYHICDSEICFDKCSLCGKQCQFPRHDHDHLIKNPEANRQLLIQITENEDGSKIETIVADHLCGDAHACKNQCEKEGICKINYETEERIWVSPSTGKEFPYSFQKPIRSQNECTKQILKWQVQHLESHECDQQHRCDQQCPECLSFCTHDHNHEGNHQTSNHRNKELCVFISESDSEILIKDEDDSSFARQYKAGESATPETCYLSCKRQGRAHAHLRECRGGDQCASKLFPNQARHSNKSYYPYKDKQYDEILCKGYWNSIGWETPIQINKELEKEVGLCNFVCGNKVHTKDNMNYCLQKAWHTDGHNIDPSNCNHKGSSSSLIDICFTVDTTASMGFAIPEVKKAIRNLMKKFKDTSLNLLFAIVCYRDHPPQDQSYGRSGVLINNLNTEENIIKIVDTLTGCGGGDEPENVICALYQSCKEINWRRLSQRFILHIGDSPPHGKEYGCTSKDPTWNQYGCPCGIKKEDVYRVLHDLDIKYFMLKCSSSLNMTESIFQSTFGMQFRKSIEIKNHSELNLVITKSVIKETKISQEFYHIKSFD